MRNNVGLTTDRRPGECAVVPKDTTDEAVVLSVGAIYGGPEFSHHPDVPWKRAIHALTQRVSELRQGVESDLDVNIVFHVPGSIAGPDFSGSRTGSFNKRDAHLMVQIALPPEAPEDQDAYLIRAVRESLDTIDAWNRRKDQGFDLSALRALVDLL
jgi:hypothetical protein